MDKSPLSTLPPELRLVVYDLALTYPEPIKLNYYYYPAEGDSKIITRATLPPYPTSLMQTCAQIRRDCEDAFFRQNKFTIHVVDFPACALYPGMHAGTFKPLKSFTEAIGSSNAAVLPLLAIDLGEVTTRDLLSFASGHAIEIIIEEYVAASKRVPHHEVMLKVQVRVGGSTTGCEPFSVAIDFSAPAVSFQKAEDDLIEGFLNGKWNPSFGHGANTILNVMADWGNMASRIGQER